jgi:hypothetical protein
MYFDGLSSASDLAIWPRPSSFAPIEFGPLRYPGRVSCRSYNRGYGLARRLRVAGVPEQVVQNALESGYYMRTISNFGAGTFERVADRMYGNKAFSGSFEFEEFASYLKGDNTYGIVPPFREVTVKTRSEIRDVLSEPERQRYLSEGSLTFRGQWREYHFKRQVPNPRRADEAGYELSIMPGMFRQFGDVYRFSVDPSQGLSLGWWVDVLEPSDPHADAKSHSSHDLMRVEQHYASPTGGLDLTFDIDTALFFATHRFSATDGIARQTRIPQGSHCGVIYCFRFGSPSVTKSEYYIRSFDLFKTHTPERILRQHCGLPLIDSYERNIAITEIDCIIRLHPEFHEGAIPSAEYMFPSVREDAFYRRLLELKDEFPEELQHVVEYEWARS